MRERDSRSEADARRRAPKRVSLLGRGCCRASRWALDRCARARCAGRERAMTAGTDPLLSVRGLSKYFPVRSRVLRRRVGDVHAVDGVDLDVRRGETLGLVGESGCGKTTLSRLILRLIEPTDGTVSFAGRD